MQFHGVQLEYLLLCLSKVLKRDELELFCVVLWLVWKRRNVVVHGDQSRSPEAILEDAALWLMEYQAYQNCESGRSTKPSTSSNGWLPSDGTCLKLNGYKRRLYWY